MFGTESSIGLIVAKGRATIRHWLPNWFSMFRLIRNSIYEFIRIFSSNCCRVKGLESWENYWQEVIMWTLIDFKLYIMKLVNNNLSWFSFSMMWMSKYMSEIFMEVICLILEIESVPMSIASLQFGVCSYVLGWYVIFSPNHNHDVSHIDIDGLLKIMLVFVVTFSQTPSQMQF